MLFGETSLKIRPKLSREAVMREVTAKSALSLSHDRCGEIAGAVRGKKRKFHAECAAHGKFSAAQHYNKNETENIEKFIDNR